MSWSLLAAMSPPRGIHVCGQQSPVNVPPVYCPQLWPRTLYEWSLSVTWYTGTGARNRFVSFILQSKHHRQQNRRDIKLQMTLFVISAPSHFAIHSFFCFRNFTENVCWLWLSYRKLKYVLFSKMKKFKYKVKMWNSMVQSKNMFDLSITF